MEADPIADALPAGEREQYLRPEHDHHAGKWETSILKELRPELVDLARIAPERGAPITSIIDPECGIVVAEDPRCDDLEQYGRKITAKIVEAMNLVCDRLLAEL
jgi:creatinine amidohydrolase/Fe(II)-dependent formamide hydrolase-like protein